jgi:uncharacterized protein YdeI (YjbR/CyaY-like superfamily)
VATRGSKPRSFASRAQLRAWLERNHARVAELNLRLFRVHAREHGVTYREALDEALCFGWIDGVRRAFDDDSFTQRFSPRRPRSKWSQVNRRRMRELQAAGLVVPAGLAALKAASKEPAGYSFESRPTVLAKRYLVELAAHGKAYAYFQSEAPWYRRTTSFYVMSAKQEATRLRRLARLIECCERQERIGVLASKSQKPRATASQ